MMDEADDVALEAHHQSHICWTLCGILATFLVSVVSIDLEQRLT